MAYFTTSRLIRKYGQEKVLWIRDALNDGKSQEMIAHELKLSKARTCQICKKIMRRRWEFGSGAIDAFKFELSLNNRASKDLRAIIRESDSIKEQRLKLITGDKVEAVDK